MVFRSYLFRSLLVISAAAMAACSSTPVELEPMELENFDEQAQLEQLWSASAGRGQDVRYTLLTPRVSGDTIYVSDNRGEVYAFDRENGKRLWRVRLKEPVSGGVGISGDLLLLGTYDAEVIALNREDGSERWRSSVSSEILSAPQGDGNTVVAQTFDGRLFALDHATGERRWTYEATMPLLTLRGNATPLVANNTVYAGFANGKVVALQAEDGLLVWEQRIAIPQGRSELERMVDVDSSPLLVGNILLVVGYQGELVAMSRASGRPLWSLPASSYNDLSAGGGQVYITNANSRVEAYSINNGQSAWQNEKLLRRKTTAPTAVGDYVAVGDEEGGYLHLLSQDGGDFVARRRIDGAGLRSPMVAVDDILYVYSNDGKLQAFRAQARSER